MEDLWSATCTVGFVIAVIVIGIALSNDSSKKRQQRRERYEKQTPARRALITQLYEERIDLKEITFILRKADYRGEEGEEITEGCA